MCAQTAVDDVTIGKELLSWTYRQLEQEGIIIKPFQPDFALIDRSDLKKRDRTGRERQGVAKFRRLVVNGSIEQFQMQIFLLKGLPTVTFISACAHELMHIWFYSRGITDASPQLVEGSCNLASYLVLKKRKDPEAAYLIQQLFLDKHKHYGKGFRKMHGLLKSRGTSCWLEYIATRKK